MQKKCKPQKMCVKQECKNDKLKLDGKQLSWIHVEARKLVIYFTKIQKYASLYL